MLLWKNGRIFTGNISFTFPENFSVLHAGFTIKA